MFRSILVPLDGSPFAEHALPFALGIALRARATVQLAHVHVPSMQVTGISVLDSGADEQIRERETAYLDSTAHKWMAAAPGVQVSTSLLEGVAPEALRGHVAEDKADLIVMATHGRGVLSRFWLGSVADTLVRTSPVPLLLIRPADQPPEVAVAAPFHQLLITLDGSPEAEQALQPAVKIGRLMGARYKLLRVVKPVLMMDTGLGWTATVGMDEGLTRQLIQDAQSYLDQVAGRLRQEGLTVQTRVVLNAQPVGAILEETRGQGADLVCLATHGRRGLGRLLLGSVADKVLRGLTTPVVMCRPQMEEPGRGKQ